VRDLRGKVAVVTGGASGIGFGLAERFAAEGMKVVVADVEQPALDNAVARLKSSGAEVLGVQTDVRKADQVESLAEQTVAHFGAIHVVCNNAGIMLTRGTNPWEIPVEDWEWTLGVNLWGIIHGVRSFVPRLIAQGEGHVVNTASMAGLISSSVGPAYTVSKFGVVALSETLYLQLQRVAPNVGVSVLCPGIVNTRITEERNRPPELHVSQPVSPRREVNQVQPAPRFRDVMEPSAVADVVVEAIKANRFYVFPHDSEFWLGAVHDRLTNIVERRQPAFLGSQSS